MLYLRTNGPSKLVRHLKQVIWKAYGRLMDASHVSLEHDYQVTGLSGYLSPYSLGTRRRLGRSYDRSRLWWLLHRPRKQR